MTTEVIKSTDREQVRQFLRLVADPVVEIRQLIDGNRKRVYCGYFDDIDKATDAVLRLDQKEPPAAIYCTLNSLQPELLARYHNRMEDWAKLDAILFSQERGLAVIRVSVWRLFAGRDGFKLVGNLLPTRF